MAAVTNYVVSDAFQSVNLRIEISCEIDKQRKQTFNKQKKNDFDLYYHISWATKLEDKAIGSFRHLLFLICLLNDITMKPAKISDSMER